MTAAAMEIAKSFSEEIAERATEFEDQGFVSQDIADRIAQTGLYRLCNMPEHGGMGSPPQDYAEVIEYLAQFDASTAWVLFIGMTSALSISNLPDEEVAQIDPAGITAGVFAPMGRAVPAQEKGITGFRLSGRWQWGSGSHNCAYITGNGFITDADGKIQMLENGTPDQRTFFMDRDQIELLDTWHVSGLKGSGSTDFTATDIFVPANRVFDAQQLDRPDVPINRFPLFGFLPIGIAAVAMGIARASLDGVIAIAKAKTPQGSRKALAGRATAQITVAKAEARLRSAKLFVYDAIDVLWDEAQKGGKPSIDARRDLRLSLTHAVQNCSDIVTELYTLAGGSSVYLKNPIQRQFRDIHVVTQHMMVNESSLEPIGRLFLDVPTDTTYL